MPNRCKKIPIVADVYISYIGCLLIIGVAGDSLRISIATMVGI